MTNPARFRARLLAWFDGQQRNLPWRGIEDPYSILVSEVMLQQTRVVAVIPFYARFLSLFPTVAALAGATEETVLTAWSGLGYYSRARNLQKAAQAIHEAGSFPRTREELIQLPGIGGYTASAVASIAFNQPCAAVDGNVMRVLARLYNDASDVSNPSVRIRFQEMAQKLLDVRRPGPFNEAMMELGATVCVPKQPNCPACPVAEYCAARAAGSQNDLPVKARGGKKVQEKITLLWIERAGKALLRQRNASESRLAGFWELPQDTHVAADVSDSPAGTFRHAITTFDLRYTVVRATLKGRVQPPQQWIPVQKLDRIPLTTATVKALRVLGVRTK